MDDLFSTAWTVLVVFGAGAPVLELSEDQGERAQALAAAGARVTALRPNDTALGRLENRSIEAYRLDAVPSGRRFEAAFLSLASGRTRGGQWLTERPGPLLAAIRPLLIPGAPITVSLENPLYDLPLLARARDHVRGPGRAGRARGRFAPWPPSLTGIIREVEQSGYTEVRVFTPIPHAHDPKFLVPLESRAILSHFFRSVVTRPRARSRRLALRLARLFVAVGLFPRIVPWWEIVARASDP